MKKTKACYVFIFDGFADWEPSLAMAALNSFTAFDVKTVAVTKGEVRSMGNMSVLPDLTLSDLSNESIDLLLLPGGMAWEEGRNLEILSVLNKTIESGGLIAAICGATTFLAQQGYLNAIMHTSNYLPHLKESAPAYRGEDWYVNRPAVKDGNIITASGTAMVEFAEQIFQHFQLLKKGEMLTQWFSYFIKPSPITV